jgi:hypothetical protein
MEITQFLIFLKEQKLKEIELIERKLESLLPPANIKVCSMQDFNDSSIEKFIDELESTHGTKRTTKLF